MTEKWLRTSDCAGALSMFLEKLHLSLPYYNVSAVFSESSTLESYSEKTVFYGLQEMN